MSRNQPKQEEEVSLGELLNKAADIWRFLVRKWLIILVAGLLGAGAGLTYALLKPVKYISRLSFVVEDSKASGGGGLAAIAGQFGFDLGGSGGGFFSGDNILLFLKSESLCRETLLTPYDSMGKQLLADRYIESSELKKKWAKDDEIGVISFAQFKNGVLPRKEDSLMQLVIKNILEKDLSVSKPDKKASFIEVSATMRDEMLSQFFAERLVGIATSRYVDSKIKVKALNVTKLQHRADSLAVLLNSRTYSAAAAQQNLIDINPALRMAPVPTEITARDKTMTATIFAEVVKNLEIAKVALSQETPAIQMVDQSSFPLRRDKAKKLTSLVTGGLFSGILVILFLLVRRWLKQQLDKTKKEETKTVA